MLTHWTAIGAALAGNVHGWLHTAGGAGPATAGGGRAAGAGRELAFAALGSWLLAEALGAYMLRSWFARGGARQPAAPDRMPVPFLLGHAGMAASGFVCWIIFLATTARAAAWLALCFIVPAIGFGISTVTVWTPYPGRRRGLRGGEPAGEPWRERPAAPGVISDTHLRRALEDEALTSKLVDDLLASNLAGDSPAARRGLLDPRTIIPLTHGVLAITTFLLVTLAAIAAR